MSDNLLWLFFFSAFSKLTQKKRDDFARKDWINQIIVNTT